MVNVYLPKSGMALFKTALNDCLMCLKKPFLMKGFFVLRFRKYKNEQRLSTLYENTAQAMHLCCIGFNPDVEDRVCHQTALRLEMQ